MYGKVETYRTSHYDCPNLFLIRTGTLVISPRIENDLLVVKDYGNTDFVNPSRMRSRRKHRSLRIKSISTKFFFFKLEKNTAMATLDMELQNVIWYISTRGIYKKDHEGKQLKILIFDTAGQEFISVLRKQHYAGASGAAIVFDLTSRKSFEDLDHWVEELKEEIGEVKTIFVGNKMDLVDTRVITREEARSYAEEKGGIYLESSAKLDHQISDIFLLFVENALSQI